MVASAPVNQSMQTDSKSRLRMWLSLLRTSKSIETEIRDRLRIEFDETLPRFDVMAALFRQTEGHVQGMDQGMAMSSLSKFLMVSNGNVTGIVDRLVRDGLVARSQPQGDRRSWVIKLTDEGAQKFTKMAAAHEQWINHLLITYDGQEADHLTKSILRLNKKRARKHMTDMKNLKPKHFSWRMQGNVAIVSLHGAERKNPLTFESYAELRDMFRDLAYADDIGAVVFTSNGGNFCSGGDVHDIIAPLTKMDMKGLLAFTRMTGDLVKAMINCSKPIITAIDGICVGAGAIIAMASDIRYASNQTKTAFLFTRVGLAGCDMGACAMLPRIIGQGRAAELLYSGRVMSADEGLIWGFYNQLVDADDLESHAIAFASKLADGPTFAHGITKTQLNQEWSMGLDQAIEAEAQAQAICMQTQDFKRAYNAFVKKTKPVFEGD